MSHPQYPYGQQPPQAAYVPPLSGKAMLALAIAFFNMFLGWCLLGLPGLLAIYGGHQALKETSTGQRRGHGVAQAALFVGYPFTALYLLIGVIALVSKAVER